MLTYTPSTLSLRRAVAARIDEALSRDIEHASTLSLRRAVAARGAVAGRSPADAWRPLAPSSFAACWAV